MSVCAACILGKGCSSQGIGFLLLRVVEKVEPAGFETFLSPVVPIFGDSHPFGSAQGRLFRKERERVGHPGWSLIWRVAGKITAELRICA